MYVLSTTKNPAPADSKMANSNAQTATNDSQLSSLPDDWQTYISPEWEFAINHPSDVKIELTQNGVHFLKLGPTQSTGTELFDGLSLLVFTAQLQNISFEAFAQQEHAKLKNDPIYESVSDLSDVKVANYEGYSFTADGLGKSTTYYLKNGEKGYIKITDMTVEPANQNRDFKKTVTQMLNSFQITTNPSGDTVTSADNAPSGSLHNLPVPKAVSAVKSFAAHDLGAPEGQVLVLSAFERDWPNSCLGLAQEGEMCAEVITPGYEITIEAKGQQKIYHTNSDGSIIKIKK
jgi:hypothetical protein